MLKKEVKLSELKGGDWFRFDGKLFIKTARPIKHAGLTRYAVSLEDGCASFGLGTEDFMVIPFKITPSH